MIRFVLVRYRIFVLASFFVLASQCKSVVSQETSLEDILPSNTSLLFQTDRIDQLIQYFQDSSLFQDSNWIKAVEAVTDDRFPLIHRDRIEPLLELVSELQDVAVNIERLNVVIHDSRHDGPPPISILVESDEKTIASLTEILGRFNSLVDTISKPIDIEPKKSEPVQEVIFSQQIGKWWALSDSEKSIDMLARNLVSPLRNPLGKSRKFKTIRRMLARKANDLFCATIYADTNSLISIVPGLSKDKWQAMRMKELPACGVSIRFPAKGKRDDSDKLLSPDIVLDTVVMFTFPRTGYGKMLEAFRPIPSFPALGLSIYELNVQEVDSPARFQAIAEMQDSISNAAQQPAAKKRTPISAEPEMKERLSYREKTEQNYAAMGRDLQEALGFSSGSLLMRYVDEQTREHEILQMRRVTSTLDAKNYTRRFVEYLNKSRSRKRRITKHDCDHGDLYVAAETAHQPGRCEAYFSNKDWYMIGIETAIRKQLSTTYEGESIQWIPYQERIEDLRRRVFLEGDLVRVDCFSPYSWIVEATSPDASRIDEKRKTGKTDKTRKLEIECVEDLRARVLTLFGLAIANRFGSQIHLHAQDDQMLRIVVGVYESPEVIFGQWKQKGDSPYRLQFGE